MGKHGTPMYRAAQDCYVFATLEGPNIGGPGKDVKIVRYRGPSAKACHAAVRRDYPEAEHIGFGAAVWITR